MRIHPSQYDKAPEHQCRFLVRVAGDAGELFAVYNPASSEVIATCKTLDAAAMIAASLDVIADTSDVPLMLASFAIKDTSKLTGIELAEMLLKAVGATEE